MTTIHRNDIAHIYINMINDKTPKDICWCYNQQFNGIGLYTEGSLHDQMKMWRTMALEGKIEIMNYNNMKRKTFDGKEWYIMVIQPKEDREDVPLDPVGMMLLGVFVSLLLTPIVLFQVLKSWHLSSAQLDEGPKIESLH